jgi:hypothetical protein
LHCMQASIDPPLCVMNGVFFWRENSSHILSSEDYEESSKNLSPLKLRRFCDFCEFGNLGRKVSSRVNVFVTSCHTLKFPISGRNRENN